MIWLSYRYFLFPNIMGIVYICTMETVNKPISETSLKLIALISERYKEFNRGYHFSITGKDKAVLAKKIGVTEKRLNNCLTELVTTRNLTRVSNGVFIYSDQSNIETTVTRVASGTIVKVHVEFIFRLN